MYSNAFSTSRDTQRLRNRNSSESFARVPQHHHHLYHHELFAAADQCLFERVLRNKLHVLRAAAA